jgi:hypothetical protein
MKIFAQIHPVVGKQLPISFEALAEQLGERPGMYFEMDGSFVWVDHESVPPGQMDGMVYDLNGKLEYVELKGAFNAQQWGVLCSAVCGLIQNPYEKSSVQEDKEFAYSVMDRIARVHLVKEGCWITISEIANQIASVGYLHGE